MLLGMKTSTIVWTLAVLILLLGTGAYWYSVTPVIAPTTTSQTEIPNPSGSNLPVGDLTPTPSTPIGSSSTSVGASTTLSH
jgi:hypothetical protein